jgi:anthranilate/para-aminobenzoate synthase component I
MLRASVKDRAENLMIVDLMRNDLSKISLPGSVRVTKLFDVEPYPTVHQMTSTIEAQLRDGLHTPDILAAMFPCGSITGAPKRRAMEIIDQVETGMRGAYTGSLGYFGADGDAAFNVLIRTLEFSRTSASAVFSVGSGLVSDSTAEKEWAECWAKTAFLHDPNGRRNCRVL